MNNPLRYIDPSGHTVETNYSSALIGIMMYGLVPEESVSIKVVSTLKTFYDRVEPEIAKTMEESNTLFLTSLDDNGVLSILNTTNGKQIGVSNDEIVDRWKFSVNREDFVDPTQRAIESIVIGYLGSLVIESATPLEVGGAILNRRGYYLPGTIMEFIGAGFVGWGANIVVNEVQGKKFPSPVDTWNEIYRQISDWFDMNNDPGRSFRT